MKKENRKMDRRKFLTATGLGAASLGLPTLGAAAEMTEKEKANIKVVNRFLHVRWNANPLDYNELSQLLADDCVKGIEPKRLTIGREAILADSKKTFNDAPTRFTAIVQQWACGDVVVHERYEGSGVGRNGGPPSVGRGVGVFQVVDGKIKKWQWYGMEMRPGLQIPANAFKP
jgi:limonene-1,2-epoxide hydrolase